MMTVLTTLIESIDIDRAALAQQFVAARVSYRGWNKGQRDEELPGLVTRIYRAGPVLALVQHRKESEYWVLLPFGASLDLTDDTLARRKENLDSIPQWVLMALLVRAVPRVLEQSASNAGQRFEADGLYYVVARKSVGTNHIITTVQVSVEWSIGARQHRLAISTVTFTPLKLHEKPDGQLPRTIARAPRYQPDMLGQNVVRTGRGDYVKRALWRKTKTRVPAFKLSGRVTLESYYKTRLGVLSLFLEDLRRAYGGMFQIQLKRISPTYGKRVTRKEVERTYNKLSELLQQQPVRIINQSDAADVGIDLQAQLSRRGIDAAIASTIDPGELNLLVVNDPESYEDGDIVPYKEARIQHPQAVIQSCLPDRLKDESRHVVEVLLKELFLK